jgi:molecular chaperone GrpE
MKLVKNVIFWEEAMSQDEAKTPQSETNKVPAVEGTPAESVDQDKQSGISGEEGLDRLSQELAEVKDKYVRTVAEMENMRRRMDRERGDLVKFALEHILKDLLPTLDSLEKALPDSQTGEDRGASPADSGYYTGMLMVKKQLLEVLRKHGLEAIQAKGEIFDPNLHQAIQRVESNQVDKDVVGDEYARGYTLHGRLLRPAMVSVLSPAGS